MPRSSELNRYLRVSRTATYGYLSALPLIILYEVMIRIANLGSVAQVRVGAEVWLKQLLAFVGGANLIVMLVLVAGVGIAIFYAERHRSIPIRPRYFLWLIGESALYGFVVALVVSFAVGMIFAMVPLPPDGLWMMLALSIGAGIYEELLFRVILVGGLALLLDKLLAKRQHAYPIAAVVGALIFSAVHYIGPLGDVFTLPSFTFRFLFGLALNGIFLVRGFGVAAWTHALYDVMVVTGLFG